MMTKILQELLMLSEATTATADEIRKLFRPIDVSRTGMAPGVLIVKGETNANIKKALRGKVPQSQPKFVDFIDSLKFESTWSNDEKAWIVHDKTKGVSNKPSFPSYGPGDRPKRY